MRRSRSVTVTTLLAVAVTGCYVAAPADPVSISAGDELTIVLSTEGRARLSEMSTRGGEEVSGQMVGVTADSITITARLGGPAYAGAQTFSSLRQTLSFARADIERVTVPELNRGRTAALLGAVVALTAYVVIDLFNVGGQGPGTPIPPPPPPSPFGPGR